jgi:hypothetical protein
MGYLAGLLRTADNALVSYPAAPDIPYPRVSPAAEKRSVLLIDLSKELPMKNLAIPLLILFILPAAGCKPDLIVKEANINFTDKAVRVEIANIGNGDAGHHLTYIEINQVDSPDSAKPEAQFSADIPGIVKGGVWDSGAIPFSRFSTRPGIDLNSLTTANLVVRADAKDMVVESNENNNLHDADH